jgi:pimeloyl-ACP methyl ester carboxylesterase
MSPEPDDTMSPADLHTTTVPFTAGDGRRLNLLHVEGPRSPTRGPVLLVHGAGVRANIFRAPVERSLVDVLVERGHDVWLENWRASIDVEPSAWDLDEAAVHDHPAAVRTVVAQTGVREVKAVIHCQGSTSFAMSAVAGLVPEVTTIVSNAVALHPVVPRFSRFKMGVVRPLLGRLTDYLDPSWGLSAPDPFAKAITTVVRVTHRECDNLVCRMVSFTYGSGFPALWRHENLNDATHDWLSHEFAKVPMTFFDHMARCVSAGSLVSLGRHSQLPADFTAQPPKTDARFVLFAGARNRCFLSESQERTFAFLDRHQPQHHAVHILPDYGHLDVFMGHKAAADVFPTMVQELEA